MFITVDYGSKEAVYMQIFNQVVTGIIRGELKAGESLPSARYLSKNLELNVLTVNKAYHKLQEEGFIDITPKKGSTVRPADNRSSIASNYIIKDIKNQLESLSILAYRNSIAEETLHNIIFEVYKHLNVGSDSDV